MRPQGQLGHGFGRDLGPGFIKGGVQIGLTAKAGCGGGSANEVEHGFVTVQGMSGPVATNEIEHAMLDQVPLRGPRGVMINGDNQPELISQLL